MLEIITVILKEILKLLLNDAAKPVTATVAPAVPRKLRDAWVNGMLDKWKKVVFIHPNDNLVRIGPNVKGRVYVWDGDKWELSRNKVSLPEGWLAGPLNLPEGEAE